MWWHSGPCSPLHAGRLAEPWGQPSTLAGTQPHPRAPGWVFLQTAASTAALPEVAEGWKRLQSPPARPPAAGWVRERDVLFQSRSVWQGDPPTRNQAVTSRGAANCAPPVEVRPSACVKASTLPRGGGGQVVARSRGRARRARQGRGAGGLPRLPRDAGRLRVRGTRSIASYAAVTCFPTCEFYLL